MKYQFQHSLVTSFMLWFDHYLLDKGEAYSNTTGQFYRYTDSRVGGQNVFGSAYKQFVSDSSITGANICSGIYADGIWKTRSDGLKIDFDNGRVLSNTISAGATITGSFAVKDVNVYFVNQTEEDLIIENKLKPSSDFPTSGTYITPYDFTVPAVFINTETFRNTPFAFGGEDKTTTTIKAVVISDDIYKLDGVLSIFADSRNEVFKILPATADPYNEWKDLKDPPYNYNDLVAASGQGLFFIENVWASKLSDKAKKTIESKLFIGFLDFDISTNRFPRQ